MRIVLAALALVAMLCVVWFGFSREPVPSPPPAPPDRDSEQRAIPPILKLMTHPIGAEARRR